jgi:folate-binding protein YgfZ
MTAPNDGYRAVSDRVGWVDRSDRVRLDFQGPDRVRFLQNLTTNDVKRLAPGRGCEAFVTSPQGRTLAFVTLLVAEDRILLRTEPGSLPALVPHLQKYGALDDVTWDDVGPRTFEYHLAGPLAGKLLGKLGLVAPAEGDLVHLEARIAEVSVRIVREEPTGRPGWTLIGDLAGAPPVAGALRAAGGPLGLVEVDAPTFDALRIEAGTPLSGLDVTPENLPQEVGRDARAINFVKGCYLGQETVARLDALGHVNKLLKGLRVEAEEVPPPGTALEAEGKKVGTVTSSAVSPGWGRPLALGYVRVAQAVAGTELALALDGSRPVAVVTDLPMLPPQG